MKNLFVVALTVLSLIALGACTKGPSSVGCLIGDQVASAASVSIASALQCSHPDAVQASLVEAASKAGLCQVIPSPSPSKGLSALSVGSSICDGVASILIGSVAPAAIPSAWGCTAENAQALLKGAASSGCAKVFK